MKEYDFFIPLYYNDGSPVEPKKFQVLQQRLLQRFNGLTFFPQPNQGFWKMGGVIYRDEIVVYRVVAAPTKSLRRWLLKFKEELKRQFKQEEVFIVGRKVEIF